MDEEGEEGRKGESEYEKLGLSRFYGTTTGSSVSLSSISVQSLKRDTNGEDFEEERGVRVRCIDLFFPRSRDNQVLSLSQTYGVERRWKGEERGDLKGFLK